LRKLIICFDTLVEEDLFEKSFQSFQIDENKYDAVKMKLIISDSIQGKRNQKVNKLIVAKMSIFKPKEGDLPVQSKWQEIAPIQKKPMNAVSSVRHISRESKEEEVEPIQQEVK
jgi:hypothetical protein